MTHSFVMETILLGCAELNYSKAKHTPTHHTYKVIPAEVKQHMQLLSLMLAFGRTTAHLAAPHASQASDCKAWLRVARIQSNSKITGVSFRPYIASSWGDQPCMCVLVPLFSAVYTSTKGIELHAG